MRKPLAAILFVIAIAFASPVLAWDTKEFYDHTIDSEPGYENWRSLWLCDPSVNIGRTRDCSRNEHEWLADRALRMAISGRNPWAIRSPTELYVIDLNSSYFRPDLVEGESGDQYQRQPSSWTGPLEERDLASPPHFAGVADFTYTIYDWINKNRLCPPHPRGELRHCHNYSVWMGAGFNSSHFGTQAILSYGQLHGTALWAARHAARLRTSLEGQNNATQLVFEDNIHEAELMALAYEGAAQHFLQDRWSTGHMWQRWNGPDFNQNPYSNDIGQAAVIGAFSGVIHGSEAVTTLPMPLSSPLPGVIYGVNPVEWRTRNGSNAYGVGDYRVEDMFDGFVGSDYLVYRYTNWSLNVSTQRTTMMRCLSSSYREVIQAFGAGPNGGYGIDSVRTRGSGGLQNECLDPWATNWSIWKAWGVLNASDTVTTSVIPLVVRTMLPSQAGIDASEVSTHTLESVAEILAARYGVPITLTVDRAALTRISSAIFWGGLRRADGIDLALGGMGSFGQARQGGSYSAPNYLEPTDLSTLREEDPRGRDTNTIFGFFNRAHAGQYCSGAQERFDRLRVQIRGASASDEERTRARAVCRYLAQRIFAETSDGYRGPMRSYQVGPEVSAGATSTPQIAPVCAWSPTNAITTGPDDDTLPYYLHPGYVPFNFSTNEPNNRQWSDVFGEWGYAQHSVANWCDSTPVINTVEDEGDAAPDIVATVTNADRRIEFYGLNFGAGRGRILVGRSWDNAVVIEDIVRWYDDRITITLGEQFDDISFDEHDEAYVFIEKEASESGDPLPGNRSVGRFVLLNDIPRPKIVSMRIFRDDEEFYTFEAPEPSEDPGPRGTPPPDPEPGAFRPISPGEVRFEIEFDMDIAREEDEERFLLAGEEIEGEWRGRRRWRGEIELPDGADYASSFRGVHPVHVNVRAEEGGWIDGDPRDPGSQPDESNRVLIDIIPIHVQRIQVRGGRRTVYSAEWTGGPDLEEVPNLSTQAMGDPERMLRVSTARAAPMTGDGRLRFELSAPVTETPVVTVGGATVEMEGEGARWQGRFDYEQAQTGAVDGDLPITISATDGAGKGLDADPRSVVQILPLETTNNIWARYEASRGDVNTSGSGGTDTWHRIGEPPALSMIIILDASGSMGEVSRMENAKAGIRQTLDGLPEDQRIELAGVVFYDCGSMNTTGFTRNIQQVRDFLLSASPSGATPLAEAHGYARNLLATTANPGAQDWRYVTFTDGAETCDGNVAAATQDLEQLLRDHRRLQEGREPEEQDEEEVAREALPQVTCNPASWRGYQMEVVGNGSGLDDIKLLEHWYIERALPDGRCFARIETKMYYVHYGSIRNRRGGPTRSDWGINSRSSEETVDFGTSRLGVSDLDRVRNAAQALRPQTVSLDAARGQIADAVAAALLEQEGS